MSGTPHIALGERKTDPGRPTQGNLPIQLTPFVGREEVKRAVTQHLLRDDVRLLTLIGPPGIGKTRLSLEVAAEIAPLFEDGVWFVGLAPVTDPALVISSIAHALGLKQAGGRPLSEILEDYLRGKQLLLVLDNFEQVVEAAPMLAELLAAAPGLKALVTSREALRVRGEQEFAVPSLTLPNLDHLPSAEQVSHYEAVQLFAQRARSANLDFRITDENALIIAAICWRLDGLPLAIELAAARTKLLPPQALFERLGQRLLVLTGGARDLPPRHKTLRSAIEWSHNLLDEDERKLFRRLGVFMGGCSWDAVDAVCNADGSISIGTLDALTALVDKSLVQQTRREDGGEPRLVMLETIKEYALEQLEESGEAEEIRQRHTLYFLKLAEEATGKITDKITGKESVRWLQRLDEEHDNLQAALQWARHQSLGGRAEAETGLRLVVALGRFWYIRGYMSMGRDWIHSMLALPGAEKSTEVRANALMKAASLAYVQCDYQAARSVLEECLAISREIGYERGVGLALEGLGEVATEEGDYVAAPRLFKESLSIMRAVGEAGQVASVLNNLGYVALRTGDYAAAFAPFEECLELYRGIDSLRGTSYALTGLGEAALRLGDYERATAWLEETLQLRTEIGDKWGIAISFASLGWVALMQKAYARATVLLSESIVMRRAIGDIGGLAWCLEKLADVAREQLQIDRAVRLLGAAKTLRDSVGSVIDPADQPEHDRNLARLRAELGEEAFAVVWAEGQAMPLEAAIKYALEAPPPQPVETAQQPLSPPPLVEDYDGLTRRECEVAALIAQSKSNAEIAEAMVVSKRTVETHVTNILSKLSFTSRGQIAAWAIKKKLVPA